MTNSHLSKQTLLSCIVLVALYSSWCAFGYYSQLKMEKLSYKSIANVTGSLQKFMGIKTLGYSHKNVEIRQYPSFIVVQSIYHGVSFESAIDMGLQDIGSYLMGKNSNSKKIQMTAPYMIQRIPLQNAYLISFVIPDYYKMVEVPKPLDRRLVIKQIPAKKVAAKMWRGPLPNEETIERKKRVLQKHIQYSQYQLIGNLKIFQYDSPMTPGFIRKNQVIFQVRERVTIYTQ